jgi:excisionase family DNA binding protein
MDSDEKHLSVKEASAIFNCSEDTVHRMVDEGQLKAFILLVRSSNRRRKYRSKRIAKSEIERYIRSHPA